MEIFSHIDFGQVQLAKAQGSPDEGKREIFIKASVLIEDMDKEAVKMDAIKDSLDFFLRKAAGKITYEHITESSRSDPRILIGEAEEAAFTKDKKEFFAKGFLYKGVEWADTIYKQMNSGAKYKASIGGQILKREEEYVEAIGKTLPCISRLRMTHIALTAFPVNPATESRLKPFGAFLKSLHSQVKVCWCDDKGCYCELRGGGCEADRGNKSLTTGPLETDVSQKTGGGSLTVSPINDSKLIDTSFAQGLFKDWIRTPDITKIPDQESLIGTFRQQGATKDEASFISKFIGKNSISIEKILNAH